MHSPPETRDDWLTVATGPCQRLRESIASVLLGKEDVIDLLLIAILAGEHVLLEDVPGVGKTLAAKAMAASLEGSFSRMQFTPDLLPADITGSMIYRSNESRFEFVPGPVFANVVLADEINRAPPRTQSALLEAMSENQVSIDGQTHRLPNPFIVIATQNPLEYEGTYALPESQLDRFLIRTSLGYPPAQIERAVLRTHQNGEPVDQLRPAVTTADVAAARSVVGRVRFDDSLADYLLEIVHATREYSGFAAGVSTRGALSFFRGCQARAVTRNRDFVTPDDVQELAVPSLAHRVLADGVLAGGGREAVEQQIADLVASIAVPM